MLEYYGFIAIIVFIIIGLICGGFCSHVAIAKNLNGKTWGLAGFFFGLFALIAISGMPIKNPI